VHDQLLGSTQPVLSISLEPGESVVAGTGEFAWMTDSIQMTGPNQTAAGQAGMSAYLAKAEAGTVAFASRRPGAILSVEVTPEREFMVHCRAFLAATPGIELSTGFRQSLRTPGTAGGEFVLRRIGGVGRRDLPAGVSLRTHPWHIGMSDASVTVQITELEEPVEAGGDARQLAVLSGPGSVWLQSMPSRSIPPSHDLGL
jgi:uncharacterized protein (AIM24 family)